MHRYRLFFVDQDGNLLPRPRVFSSASEVVAVELSEGMRGGRAAELWRDETRLRVFSASR